MFGTSGIRGQVGEAVTADLAVAVGRAVATDAEQVVIGRDPRSSGPILVDAVASGLREGGTDVIHLGLAATPTVARSVGWCSADVGISVTASHNPPQDNGFKFWQPSGQAFDEPLRESIETRVNEERFALVPWDRLGSASRWQGADRAHVAAVEKAVAAADLSVAVDIGNGVGGITVDVLQAIGCSVETLNAQPDGRFPGRPSEPTADNCTVLREFVGATDVDLGVAHDGDADRLLAVTEEGTWIPGDVLLAIFARAAADSGDRIAAPVDTSLAVDDALEAAGASITRTRVGDVYVAERATQPDVSFGGEPSGAWIWPEETLCPDGPLAAAKLVELVDRNGPLSDMVAGIDTYPIRRDSLECADPAAVMNRVRAAVEGAYGTVDTLDGVRVDLGDAWFLIRPSGTQPLVRVTAEARANDRADEVFSEARGIVTGAMTD